jgi:hypothetical protein
VLCGGVGSGKSITSIAYYYTRVCGGTISSDGGPLDLKTPTDLYIITTAAKRDTLDWQEECAKFSLSTDRAVSIYGIKVIVDSWNNVGKYVKVKDAFFIFDEQRVVGSGSWVMNFLKIVKNNQWILLSATPGDTWMDYIPAFVANGFYKNRTEFIRQHVKFNGFAKYPKVDHYVEEYLLARHKRDILVTMEYKKKTTPHYYDVIADHDVEKYDLVFDKRWNPYKDKPVREVGELFHVVRKVVNSDPSRLELIRELLERHPRLIIFYNFDYELEILRGLAEELPFAEYNGHKHDDIPRTERWAYAVQYTSGSEGWNCIQTNAIAFYSASYSYRAMTQAAGRIDRLNTPYLDLYYYLLRSSAKIDMEIAKCLKTKKDFNETAFAKSISREKHGV